MVGNDREIPVRKSLRTLFQKSHRHAEGGRSNRDLEPVGIEFRCECGCGGGPVTGRALIVRRMNSLVAHLLAAILADAADQLSGTPPSAQVSVADRSSCCGGAEAGAS